MGKRLSFWRPLRGICTTKKQHRLVLWWRVAALLAKTVAASAFSIFNSVR
jgi:hypothetical protein